MGDKPLSEAQKKAMAKYDANNTKQFRLKLNKKTDADIITRFKEEQEESPKTGIQGYIKRLVRADIETRK